jgi:adenylate kinase
LNFFTQCISFDRGYNDTKLNDNIEAEIMQLMLDEARDSYRPEIVHECNSNTLEDLEQNVARIVQWTDLYKKEHQ